MISKLPFLLIAILFLFACKEKKTVKAGIKMQEFIISISNYARAQDPDFILIPQNGEEILFEDIDPEKGLRADLIQAIDGYGVEELFYNGDSYSPDDYRLGMLRKVNASLKVMVADYLPNADASGAFQAADAEQFIAFPRTSSNYDYKTIPGTIHHENANNIQTLAQAQNYLYLISTDNYSDKAGFLSAIQQTNFARLFHRESGYFAGMKIGALLSAIEVFAAPELQEEYDNAGLITGSKEWECTGALCTLDVTVGVLEEAVKNNCNLVVAHHPIVFKGLRRINGRSYVEQVLIKAIKEDIAIYAAHTNLDNVVLGVNGVMASKLGLQSTTIL